LLWQRLKPKLEALIAKEDLSGLEFSPTRLSLIIPMELSHKQGPVGRKKFQAPDR
jgi:hypothetical protein